MPDQQRVQFSTGGIPMTIVMSFVPIVLSMALAYGVTKQTTGEQVEKLRGLQQTVEVQGRQINQMHEEAVTREQLDLLIKLIENVKQDQQDIKQEIRELRRTK